MPRALLPFQPSFVTPDIYDYYLLCINYLTFAIQFFQQSGDFIQRQPFSVTGVCCSLHCAFAGGSTPLRCAYLPL